MALPANQPERFYRGGAAIAALRGIDPVHEFQPEDWVASTTTLFGQPTAGLSPLPDGRSLRAAIGQAPELWLGADHVRAFGADPALLVKLLDAGERLPVHCHPSDAFARTHFGSHFGKTEAWVVVGTAVARPTVHLGFRETVAASTLAHWVTTQDRTALLAALNPVEVAAGDTVLVPAGLPHAIGAGVFIVELQQPTDLSVTLEWHGFLAEERSAHLGIGFDTALACVDRTGWGHDRWSTLVGRSGTRADPVLPLFGAAAAPFFRADRLHPRGTVHLDEPSFAVLIVLAGAGRLRTEHGGALDLRQGDTVVVPHRAGSADLTGDLIAIRCRPPAPGSSTGSVMAG